MVYRNLVGLNKELYATCSKADKLTKSIVAAIRGFGGRFLERDDSEKSTMSLEEVWASH